MTETVKLSTKIYTTTSHSFIKSEYLPTGQPKNIHGEPIIWKWDRQRLQSEGMAADSKIQAVRDFIGVNVDGWIPNGLYEDAVAKEKHIREKMMDAAETEDERKDIEENWPFQDHEKLDWAQGYG